MSFRKLHFKLSKKLNNKEITIEESAKELEDYENAYLEEQETHREEKLMEEEE